MGGEEQVVYTAGFKADYDQYEAGGMSCDFLVATPVITRKVIRSFQSLAVRMLNGWTDGRTYTHMEGHRYTDAGSLFIRKRIRKPLSKS